MQLEIVLLKKSNEQEIEALKQQHQEEIDFLIQRTEKIPFLFRIKIKFIVVLDHNLQIEQLSSSLAEKEQTLIQTVRSFVS